MTDSHIFVKDNHKTKYQQNDYWSFCWVDKVSQL